MNCGFWWCHWREATVRFRACHGWPLPLSEREGGGRLTCARKASTWSLRPPQGKSPAPVNAWVATLLSDFLVGGNLGAHGSMSGTMELDGG